MARWDDSIRLAVESGSFSNYNGPMGDVHSQALQGRVGAVPPLNHSVGGVMKYRPEIDGLRAIAVLSVVLFHLGDKVVSGGYVGVDVFFVISGYLITSLICNERKRGEFSLVSFYVRRIKRIAPALLAVVLATVALGYLVLPPGDYELLARSGRFALAGASNFFFVAHTGYFDPLADTMPLLHTWSLGVEEQFYLVWPGLLIVLASIARKTNIPILVFVSAAVAASLVAFFLVGEKDAFYMPYARAWELGLGAVLALLPEIRGPRFILVGKTLPWLGLVLIGAATCQFASKADVTGNRIVAAVIGACFIVFAIEPKTKIHGILSSTPLVFIGKISYSLYLWHFPAIVFWRYYAAGQTISPAYFGPFIVSITVIAWLSWRYIEQPCRRATLDWRLVFSAFVGAALTIGCACWAVVATHGALARIPEAVRQLRSREAMWQWQCPSRHLVGELNLCTGGAPWHSAAAHALIWGDSNAAHFMHLLDVAGRQHNVSISVTNDQCSSIVGIGYAEIGSASYVRQCDAQQRATLAALRTKEITLVILSSAWTLNAAGRTDGVSTVKAGLTRLLPEISANGRVVAIMSEIPKWSEDPIPCVFAVQTSLLRSRSFRETCRNRLGGFGKSSFFDSTQKAADDMIQSFNGRNGVVVWPTTASLCSEQSCTTTVDGEFIYRDDGHLRRNLTEQAKLDLAAMLHFGDLMELAKTGLIERGPASPPASVTSKLAAPLSVNLQSRPSP
jgi:peptidoglycan/LPS O-acetylase OafA/YrhL